MYSHPIRPPTPQSAPARPLLYTPGGGKYLDSPSPEFDRFTFSIRLNDLLARSESKTLLLAVRYSIEGREMWDNNGGQNYRGAFSKTKVDEPPHTPTSRRPMTLSDDEVSTDMMDLRSKLEKVVDTHHRTGPAFAQQSSVSTSPPGLYSSTRHLQTRTWRRSGIPRPRPLRRATILLSR